MTQPINNASNQQTPDQNQQSDKEHNMAQLRKSLEAERQARLIAEQRAAEIERVAQERIKQANPAVEDDDDDEPYIDKKRLNKRLVTFKKDQDDEIDRRVNNKVQQVLDQYKRDDFVRNNPDFQQVMSSDLVQRFAEEHKKLAENILEMPDGFERQKLVFQTIKSLGMDKPVQKEPSVQEKINANRRSPFLPAPGTNSPGYQAVGDFSETGQKNSYQQMKQLQKRMGINS